MSARILDPGDLLRMPIPKGKHILLDGSILLELCDIDHSDHHKRMRFFENLPKETARSCRFVLATRLHVRDVLRRRFLTVFLRSHMSAGFGKRSGTRRFDEVVQARLAQCQSDASGMATLSDSDISVIRDACFKCFSTLQEGASHWQFLCQMALGKKFEIVASRLSTLGVRYIKLSDLGVRPEGPQPKWSKQEELMLQYGLDSSDTAIVSLLEATDQIFGILSNAPDLLELLDLRDHLKSLNCFTFLSSTDVMHKSEVRLAS